MLPELKFDLSGISSSSLIALACPFAPGMAVISGLGLLHPNLIRSYFDLNYLGYYAKISLAIAIAYLAGFLIWITALTAMTVTSYIVYNAFCYLTGVIPTTKAGSPQMRQWRKLASVYCRQLGITDALPVDDKGHETEWQFWFSAFQEAYLKGRFLGGSALVFVSSLQSLSLVCLVVVCLVPHVQWLVLLLLFVVFVNLTLLEMVGMTYEMNSMVAELTGSMMARLSNTATLTKGALTDPERPDINTAIQRSPASPS